jgi:methionine biosynthesis protein MetW
VINLRIGYDLIIEEIPEGSRVLDLGCGDGTLLSELRDKKGVDGFGVEISAAGLSQCLEKGLYCCQGDIDDGLSDYKDNSFDYVIINQTLQDVKKPEFVVNEIMRICLNTIVSFPNLGFILNRFQLMFKGEMPKNKLLPYEWFESPNIHLLSINDFLRYCRINHYPIKKELHFSIRPDGERVVKHYPNLFAQYGLFILDGSGFVSK